MCAFRSDHADELADWLFMKEGIKIDASAIFRQTKPVYERLCIHLGIPEHGTKRYLMERLRAHVFTAAQEEELRIPGCFS